MSSVSASSGNPPPKAPEPGAPRLKRAAAALTGLDKPVPRRRHRAVRPQLANRAALDGRTTAAKQFDRLVAAVEADLGGADRLSTVQRVLIEAFAGSTIAMHNLNVRALLGQDVDPATFGVIVSSIVRVASRLGVNRVARDVTPSVKDYVKHINEQEEADA
jgi:hypothetical protein